MSASYRPWTYGNIPWNVDTEDGTYLEIIKGLNETPTLHGGPDDVLLGERGRFARNRLRDTLRIEIVGWVRGQGETEAAKAADFRTRVKSVLDTFDPENWKELEVNLEDASVWTRQARPEVVEMNQLVAWAATVTIIMEIIENPDHDAEEPTEG